MIILLLTADDKKTCFASYSKCNSKAAEYDAKKYLKQFLNTIQMYLKKLITRLKLDILSTTLLTDDERKIFCLFL